MKSRKAEMSPELVLKVLLLPGSIAGNSGAISVKPLNLISVRAAPDLG